MNWISPNLPPPNGTTVCLRLNPEAPLAPFRFDGGYRRNDRWEDLNGNEIPQSKIYGWGHLED